MGGVLGGTAHGSTTQASIVQARQHSIHQASITAQCWPGQAITSQASTVQRRPAQHNAGQHSAAQHAQHSAGQHSTAHLLLQSLHPALVHSGRLCQMPQVRHFECDLECKPQSTGEWAISLWVESECTVYSDEHGVVQQGTAQTRGQLIGSLSVRRMRAVKGFSQGREKGAR